MQRLVPDKINITSAADRQQKVSAEFLFQQPMNITPQGTVKERLMWSKELQREATAHTCMSKEPEHASLHEGQRQSFINLSETDLLLRSNVPDSHSGFRKKNKKKKPFTCLSEILLQILMQFSENWVGFQVSQHQPWHLPPSPPPAPTYYQLTLYLG